MCARLCPFRRRRFEHACPLPTHCLPTAASTACLIIAGARHQQQPGGAAIHSAAQVGGKRGVRWHGPLAALLPWLYCPLVLLCLQADCSLHPDRATPASSLCSESSGLVVQDAATLDKLLPALAGGQAGEAAAAAVRPLGFVVLLWGKPSEAAAAALGPRLRTFESVLARGAEQVGCWGSALHTSICPASRAVLKSAAPRGDSPAASPAAFPACLPT